MPAPSCATTASNRGASALAAVSAVEARPAEAKRAVPEPSLGRVVPAAADPTAAAVSCLARAVAPEAVACPRNVAQSAPRSGAATAVWRALWQQLLVSFIDGRVTTVRAYCAPSARLVRALLSLHCAEHAPLVPPPARHAAASTHKHAPLVPPAACHAGGPQRAGVRLHQGEHDRLLTRPSSRCGHRPLPARPVASFGFGRLPTLQMIY